MLESEQQDDECLLQEWVNEKFPRKIWALLGKNLERSQYFVWLPSLSEGLEVGNRLRASIGVTAQKFCDYL